MRKTVLTIVDNPLRLRGFRASIKNLKRRKQGLEGELENSNHNIIEKNKAATKHWRETI